MKKNIIISGLYSSGAGLSNVMHNLINHLRASFQIVCIGFDPDKKDGEVVKKEISGCDLYVYPVNGTVNLFRIDAGHLETYINLYKPICIITLGPIMFNRYLLVLLQKHRANVKIISYISVEGQLVDVNFLKYVNLIDFCVFYTQLVYNDFDKLRLENPGTDYGFGAVKATFIGHGIDKQSFYPMPAENDKERRRIAREKIYYNSPVNEESFIVLNLNRPSHRKKIEVTIAGFKQFAFNKENVYLHLHIGTTMSAVRQKYQDIVEKAGLKNKVIITPGPDDPDVKPEGWLNTLYNACNVGISTAKGEGWGLGLFEHAATRAAIVAPEHTSFLENWGNAAILMPWVEKEFVFFEYSDMFIVSPEEVYNALNRLYYDKNLLDKVSMDCFNRALEPKYDWTNIAERFKQIILNVSRLQ